MSFHFHGAEFLSVSSNFWGHGSLLKSSAGRALPVPAASGTCGVSRPLFKDPKISVGQNFSFPRLPAFECFWLFFGLRLSFCQLNTEEKGPQTRSPIGATFLRANKGVPSKQKHTFVFMVFFSSPLFGSKGISRKPTFCGLTLRP